MVTASKIGSEQRPKYLGRNPLLLLKQRTKKKFSSAKQGRSERGRGDRRSLTEEEIINAVRWRYRICHYLFRLGAIWILTGAVAGLFATRYQWWVVELIGLGIFMSAFALTLAIYRCPVCDHHLSKFWPYKERCAHCGSESALGPFCSFCEAYYYPS